MRAPKAGNIGECRGGRGGAAGFWAGNGRCPTLSCLLMLCVK